MLLKKSQQKMDREKREAEAKAAADAERAANAEKNGLLANAKGGDALKKLAERNRGLSKEKRCVTPWYMRCHRYNK